MDEPNLRDSWNQLSPTYQFEHAISADYPHYGVLAPNEDQLHLLGEIEGKRILELGCGGGQNSICFARRGAFCLGVDLSDEQIAYATRLAEAEGVAASVSFRQGDMIAVLRELAAEGATFDIAFSAYAFQYVADLPALFAEVREVLRPDGLFVFSLDHPLADMTGWTNNEPERKPMLHLSYFDRTPMRWMWHEIPFLSHHRTVGDIVNAVVQSGLALDLVLEPEPTDEMESFVPPEDRELYAYIPATLIVRARQPATPTATSDAAAPLAVGATEPSVPATARRQEESTLSTLEDYAPMNDGKIGIALLSFAHVHARGYADNVRDHPDCHTVAVWDEDPARGQAEADRRGLPYYHDLDDILALPEVEAVVCSAQTATHRDVLIASAQAGKHIFTEKALTIRSDEATEVMTAVEEAGIKFMISLPSRTRPEILFAKKALDEGLLGQVTLMRARIAHMAALDRWFSGGSLWFGEEEKAGGGAFFDLGCHRVDIMRWFLGDPSSCVAQMNNVSGAYDIDDNMVATITFRNQAIGIIDVSWVHRYGPNPLEIYGTEGYLGIDVAPNGPRIQFISSRLSLGDMQGYLTPTALPQPLPMPFNQWISAIKDGSPMTINIYDGWNLTQLMEGCYTAAREGREFTF